MAGKRMAVLTIRLSVRHAKERTQRTCTRQGINQDIRLIIFDPWHPLQSDFSMLSKQARSVGLGIA